MTKKERVLSAMRGEKTDKIPVSFWRHFAGAGTTLSNREVAQKHLDFYQATDLDFIKIMYDGFTAPFSLDIKTAAELRKIRPVKEDHPYVRDILGSTVTNTALREDYVDVKHCAPDSDFVQYQHIVNCPKQNVVSHTFIQNYMDQNGQDYRFETAPHPVEALRNRTRDDTTLARGAAADSCS